MSYNPYNGTILKNDIMSNSISLNSEINYNSTTGNAKISNDGFFSLKQNVLEANITVFTGAKPSPLNIYQLVINTGNTSSKYLIPNASTFKIQDCYILTVSNNAGVYSYSYESIVKNGKWFWLLLTNDVIQNIIQINTSTGKLTVINNDWQIVDLNSNMFFNYSVSDTGIYLTNQSLISKSSMGLIVVTTNNLMNVFIKSDSDAETAIVIGIIYQGNIISYLQNCKFVDGKLCYNSVFAENNVLTVDGAQNILYKNNITFDLLRTQTNLPNELYKILYNGKNISNNITISGSGGGGNSTEIDSILERLAVLERKTYWQNAIVDNQFAAPV